MESKQRTLQFRPFFKDAETAQLSIFRAPAYEKYENAAFAEFKYVPENGQTYDRSNGLNLIWNDFQKEQDRRFSGRLYQTPMDYIPFGTNIEMPNGVREQLEPPGRSAKRRRFNNVHTDSVLTNNYYASSQESQLRPDITALGATGGLEESNVIDMDDEDKPDGGIPQMYSVPDMDINNYLDSSARDIEESNTATQVFDDTQQYLKFPKYKNLTEALWRHRQNGTFHNYFRRLYKNGSQR